MCAYLLDPLYINPLQCENDGNDCGVTTALCRRKQQRKEQCKQKRKNPHLRAQSAHLRLNELCRRSNFCTKEIYKSLAFHSACASWVASPIDVTSIEPLKQLQFSWEEDQLFCS